jgi:hypothetical protein
MADDNEPVERKGENIYSMVIKIILLNLGAILAMAGLAIAIDVFVS